MAAGGIDGSHKNIVSFVSDGEAKGRSCATVTSFEVFQQSSCNRGRRIGSSQVERMWMIASGEIVLSWLSTDGRQSLCAKQRTRAE